MNPLKIVWDAWPYDFVDLDLLIEIEVAGVKGRFAFDAFLWNHPSFWIEESREETPSALEDREVPK
jgi:hypothetical protein